MKSLLALICFLLISSFNIEQSNAQGACPGPTCRSASAAAAGNASAAAAAQAAVKAADEKKKAQRDAAKAAEAVKSTAPNMSTPASKNMSQPSTMDTVNSVKLGDQNSTQNRRPEIEDIKNAKSPQQKRALAQEMKKWEREHATKEPQESGVVRVINDQLRPSVSKDYTQPSCQSKDCSKLFIKSRTVGPPRG